MKIDIDAGGMYYRTLNKRIRDAVAGGYTDIRLHKVNGQYYIGDGIEKDVSILIEGVPGNDLGAFMDGPHITVNNNAQDNVGNTMNNGRIVIHGMAGDVCGYGMRGGRIFIRDDVGYRVGIHMKGYLDKVPVIVIGGKAGDFFGEYMAGGVLILLGLPKGAEDTRPIAGDYLGTGMHGGVIYLRGSHDKDRVGAEVGVVPLEEPDRNIIKNCVGEFCTEFGTSQEEIMSVPFLKLVPVSNRPYGNMYAY
jgi:glutamate synthase domain-containing protein 3